MNIRNTLAEKIAGEIALSPKPGQTMRKWRKIFKISQSELAYFLNTYPSVICDYESGRRKSPGIQTVRKIVTAFLEIDSKKNSEKTLNRYQPFVKKHEGVLDIMEYPYGVPIKKFISEIDGSLLTSPDKVDEDKYVNGFTLIDGVKTISSFNSSNYVQLYGWSTDRALIFTGIQYGRSPMIAIRVHPVNPTVVVYHKPDNVDSLAIKLAESERIPLVITMLSLTNLKSKLKMV